MGSRPMPHSDEPQLNSYGYVGPEPDGVVQIEIPAVPPSFNQVGTRGGKFAWSKVKKQWQADVGMLLLAHRGLRDPNRALMRMRRVECVATLQFKRNARRDAGNFRVLLEKVMGDAMVTVGLLRDDTIDEYEFGAVRFSIVKDKPQKTTVELRYWRE